MEYIPAKSIISKTQNPNNWFGCDYNMNIYKGCCHGCIYCDSRSDCYKVENFDQVRAKENAIAIIEQELRTKRATGVIGTGAMSDPYNPFEAEQLLTRESLILTHKYGFGMHMMTKSSLITRDIDLYKNIKKAAPLCVNMTITTFNDELCSKLEPNVSVSSQRFHALNELALNGIYTGILLMPILPYINDTEQNISDIVVTAHDCGVKSIYPAFGVTLRQNQREYYYNKLDKLFPRLRHKYTTSFGEEYSCNSPNANNLWKLFCSLCKKYGITYKMQDIIDAYKTKKLPQQTSLF
jgi:DNA repair photolyase